VLFVHLSIVVVIPLLSNLFFKNCVNNYPVVIVYVRQC